MKAKFKIINILKKTEKAFLIELESNKTNFWYPKRFINVNTDRGEFDLWFGDNFKANFFKREGNEIKKVGEFPLKDALKDYLFNEEKRVIKRQVGNPLDMIDPDQGGCNEEDDFF